MNSIRANKNADRCNLPLLQAFLYQFYTVTQFHMRTYASYIDKLNVLCRTYMTRVTLVLVFPVGFVMTGTGPCPTRHSWNSEIIPFVQ